MMRARRLALFAALCGTAACTAIAGLDGDFVNDSTTATPAADSGAKTDGAPHDGQVATDDAPATIDAAHPEDDAGIDADAAVDFCAQWTPTGVEVSPLALTGADAAPIVCPQQPHKAFCWDFKGDNSPPMYGWNLATTSSGSTFALEGDIKDAGRLMHVAVGSGTGTSGGATLTWVDWAGDYDPAMIDPLSWPKGTVYDIKVTFQVESAARLASIVSLDMAQQTVGLALYPDPCGGKPRVGLAGHDPATFTGGAFVDLRTRYRAHLAVTRMDSTWTASLTFEGSGVIESGGAPFPAISTTAVDAGLRLGLYDVGSGDTTSDILIDEVWF